MNAVALTFLLVLAVDNGRELFVGDILEGLCTADVARVRVHSKQRLDLGDTGYNTANSDELSKMCAFDVADGHGYIGTEGLEIKIAVAKRVNINRTIRNGRNSLSSQKMSRELFLSGSLKSSVPFSSLVQDDVDDFILVTDVFTWIGH
jgi:hypothetical protein